MCATTKCPNGWSASRIVAGTAAATLMLIGWGESGLAIRGRTARLRTGGANRRPAETG